MFDKWNREVDWETLPDSGNHERAPVPMLVPLGLFSFALRRRLGTRNRRNFLKPVRVSWLLRYPS
jgi:hypothetical protein